MNAPSKVTKADTLSSALVAAFAEIEGAAKDKVNPHFKSKYADLASVIDAVKIPLTKYGLSFEQHMSPSDNGVVIETVVRHTTGETASFGSLFVPANKNDAQGFGSALTYARRYALMTAFGVPAEDDDGNAAVTSNRAANANPRTGEDQPISGPAPRTKLDGPHTSKTALRGAVNAIMNGVRKAPTNDDIDAILKKDTNKETIKQAEREWPELINGDPKIEGDGGLRGYVKNRREQLAGSLTYQLLVSTLQECGSVNEFRAWMREHGDKIDLLDGEESRKFEEIHDATERALTAMANVSAG